MNSRSLKVARRCGQWAARPEYQAFWKHTSYQELAEAALHLAALACDAPDDALGDDRALERLREEIHVLHINGME